MLKNNKLFITLNNYNHEQYLLLGYDSTADRALLGRIDTSKSNLNAFVVADHPNFSFNKDEIAIDSWGQGHYFSVGDSESAKTYFYKTVLDHANEITQKDVGIYLWQNDALNYQTKFDLIMQDELGDDYVNLTSEKKTEWYDSFMGNDSFSGIIDQNLAETFNSFIEHNADEDNLELDR